MLSPHFKFAQISIAGVISIIISYFESTQSFLIALLIGFILNIFAGFQADNVHFEMWRLCNFKGNKFKDSLKELFLIVLITYLLKLLVELMKQGEHSYIIVECLIGFAVYYYVRNSLKNLSKAYPNSRWIRFVYIVVGLQFQELIPDPLKKAWKKSKDKDLKIDD